MVTKKLSHRTKNISHSYSLEEKIFKSKDEKSSSSKLNIGIFLYPNVTMLDAYGPLQILAVSNLFNVFTFAKRLKPLPSDANVDLLPNYSFEDCPHIDVLIVPGSANPLEQIKDVSVISQLRAIGEKAEFVTSVCTGSLILAETGLLNGYQTAIHWAYADALKHYPEVTHINQRVVKDRNRISGGGITSGLDFSLELIAHLTDKEQAQALELLLEYNPEPPFKTGDHNTTPEAIKVAVQSMVYELAGDLF
ncbi:DJ-1/PfpI family protein [Vibrio sp. THAF190c]|uniref:DJ-1/PfpI family protein n=1 Tax=Vibrio sp. THAF190c TaxID=2587865 RepID=UPI00126964D0|nr:DJ-1/PfpI family protein [Vibrio sp. THAF190c]QFT11498.1 Isonitrile hydratase [Vibrio sp. THAF190c]